MTRGITNMVKGLGIGMAVGAAAGAVGSTVVRNNKNTIKKTANKALPALGHIVDNMQYIVKLNVSLS